jgi:hypothetical protein
MNRREIADELTVVEVLKKTAASTPVLLLSAILMPRLNHSGIILHGKLGRTSGGRGWQNNPQLVLAI